MYVTNQISCRSQQECLHYTIYIQYHAYAVRSVRTFLSTVDRCHCC